MLYIDTSAAAKLVLEERETGGLIEVLARARTLLVTSRVGIVELRRVGRRTKAGADRADAVAATLAIVELDERIEAIAVELDPGLSSLDALHLATALAAGPALDGFVCYDERLAATALAAGLSVVAPGGAGRA